MNDELGRRRRYRSVMFPVFAQNAEKNSLQPLSASNEGPIVGVLTTTPRRLLYIAHRKIPYKAAARIGTKINVPGNI